MGKYNIDENPVIGAIGHTDTHRQLAVAVNDLDFRLDVTGQSFPTRAAAVASTPDNFVMAIRLRGYHEDGDLGAATYVRRAAEPAHPGKLQTADGTWWEISEPLLNIEMFGGRPVPLTVKDVSVVTASYDITNAFNNMSAAARAQQRGVLITAGHWAHSATLNWYSGIRYQGAVSGDSWRAANTWSQTSWPGDKYAKLGGAVFIAYGTFAKTLTVTNITKGSQHGYGRDIPSEWRPVNNALDARFDLLDMTNQDASGATPATLRTVSVAHYFNTDDMKRPMVEDVAFILNCPKEGETFGLDGYQHYTSVLPWASVDIGVYCTSTFRGYFSFQVLGSYNDRGMLLNCVFPNDDLLGYAENNVFERCVIQTGLAVRTPDSWPVLSKTSNSITIRWTASHTFASTGKLRIGSSAFDNTEYTYTALTYSSSDGGRLTFTITENTDNIIVGGTAPDHIWTGRGNGYANTTFRDCEFFDYSHQSRVNDMSTEFGSRARAWSAALEISGYVRALRFETCVLRPVGPLMMILGGIRDTVFSHGWMEGRNLRRPSTASGTPYGYGSVIVAGPTPSMLTETGDNGIGDVMFDASRNIHTAVNRHPLRPSTPATSATPFYNMTDLVTLIWRDQSEEQQVRGSSDLRLWAQPGTRLDFRARRADGSTTRALQTTTAGDVQLATSSGGAIRLNIPGPDSSNDSVIRTHWIPGTDNTWNLGNSTFRWGTIYAGTGTINTSDETQKEQIRDLTEAERAVAVKLKGMLKAYKWKDAVTEKGTGARIHFGIMAQDVADAFESEGLNPEDYGVFCYDEWDAVPEKTELDDDGNVIVIQEAIEAGSRYGVRYDELFAFLIASL